MIIFLGRSQIQSHRQSYVWLEFLYELGLQRPLFQLESWHGSSCLRVPILLELAPSGGCPHLLLGQFAPLWIGEVFCYLLQRFPHLASKPT